MRFAPILALTVVCALGAPSRGEAQSVDGDGAGETPRIVVADLEPLSEMTRNEADQLSEVLRSEIARQQVFDMVERSQLNELLEEQELQLAGIVTENTAAEIGEFLAAEFVVIGSAGRLFSKVVITVRMVDVGSGRIQLAQTTVTDEEDVFDELTRVAVTMGNEVMEQRRDLDLQLIRATIDDDNLIQAKRYLDRYIEQEGTSAEVQELRDRILPELGERYYEEAEESLDRKNFRRARENINRALALEVNQSYFQLRDRIEIEEELFIQEREKQRELARIRAEREAEQDLARAGLPFRERFATYTRNLDPSGVHVAYSANSILPESLELPQTLGDAGVELIGSFRRRGDRNAETAFVALRPLWYAGGGLTYDERHPDRAVIIRAYGAPLTGLGFKLGWVTMTIGADAGGWVSLSNRFEDGYRAGLSGGGMGLLSVKGWESFGAFLGVKPEYLYVPADSGESAAVVRLLAGVSF